MQHVINAYLEQAKIGRKQSFRNMAVFPLLSTYSLDLDYLLLDEALSEEAIEVVEVGKEGSVPELEVVNKTPRMILILDGEELVGAKQNRIVNTTILVGAKTTLVIPVSCVEQGRWSYNSPRFSSQERILSSRMRAMKAEQVQSSVRASGAFQADQGAIWNEISKKASRRGAESPRMAMADIYEKDSVSIQEYLSHFNSIDSQVGAVFMIGDKVVGLECVGKAASFSKIFKKLVQSYALDAVEWHDPEKAYKAPKTRVTEFLKDIAKSEVEIRPSVGPGTDARLDSAEVTGLSLILEDQLLHLSVFVKENDRTTGRRYSSRMARFSSRRRKRM